MKVLITGSTGLIGSALVPFLTEKGHSVIRLVRGQAQPGAGEVKWDPQAGSIDADGIEDSDSVVHLAGESIAARWTDDKKKRIRDSRVQSTRLLSETLARLKNPPRALISTSATGYYGNRGDEVLREDSAPGTGFLAELCREWEAATRPATDAGIRVVHLRFGIVLSPRGGALAAMLTPFRLGVGGPIGSGAQYWGWLTLDDATGIIHHALTTEELYGPVNAVAPQHTTNREFTRTLGKVLGRPTIFPLPAFAARLALGEMADETLLASARVEPARLKQTGYSFRHPDLEVALRELLGK